MTPIEDYIVAKQIKTSRFDRLLKRSPNINTTRHLASPLPRIIDENERTLKPSVWLAFVSVFIMLPLIAMLIFSLVALFLKPISMTELIFTILSSIMLYIATKHSVFNKNYFYKITMNAETLTAGENTYIWSNITETAIYEKQEGRSTRSYLILFKKDRSFIELSLNCFTMSNAKIARYVEYFKNKNGAITDSLNH